MDNNKIFKGLVFLMIGIFIVAGVLWGFGKHLDNIEVNEVVEKIESVYGYRTSYSKGDNIIKVNFTTTDKDSLYELSSLALPELINLPSNIIDTLVVNAKYIEGESQSYVVGFKDIKKLDWQKIKNLDMLINILSKLM